MKQEERKRIIGQIKRYDLVSEFEEVEDVKRWLETLNERQIGNFINLNIDLSNIKKELIDSETRYILPETYYNKTIWEVKRITQPNLDDFLVVNESLTDYEKGLFTIIFIISLGVPAIITFYLLIIIKTIIPNIKENKELQEKLLRDLEKLEKRLNNTQLDKEEILGELLAIKDKYLDLIEDQEFAMELNRTN